MKRFWYRSKDAWGDQITSRGRDMDRSLVVRLATVTALAVLVGVGLMLAIPGSTEPAVQAKSEAQMERSASGQGNVASS